MNKLMRVFGSSLIIALGLVACSLNSEPTNTSPIVIQSTPTAAKLDVVVQADTSVQYTTLGQIIKFNIGVKNSGGIGVAGTVVVTGAVAQCPALITVGNLNDSLDPNESVNCTADYAITQADLDKGSVSSVLSATINGVVSNQATVSVNVGQPKVLTMTVSANPTNYSQADQEITLTYLIKYDGSGALVPTQFTVSDKLIGANPFSCGIPNTTLASGQTVTCTAKYKITQADMGLASITNLATASGAGINSAQPTSITINKGSATNPANLTSGSTIQHTVIKGEWLWQIARCYGADPVKVSEANPPTPAEISPNTNVTVPNIGSVGKIYGPPCVGTHTVQSGDTWNSIAQKYNADVTVLQMVNSNTLAVGSVLKVPLNSFGATNVTLPTSTSPLSSCVDLTRTIKVTGANSGLTHFNICGTVDATGKMKIATIKVSQLSAEVPVINLISQDITLSVITATPINEANSLIVADMNYDGNDDFRILVNVPAGPNLPFVYYLYDPATNKYIFNEAYGKITSPEFPGNNEIRSQWRESAAKWGIDTYTVANNIPRLIKRETWEAIPNTTQARHIITTFNADGTSQVTVDETIPLPVP